MHATTFDRTTDTERIIVQASIGLFVVTLSVSRSLPAIIATGFVMVGMCWSVIKDAAGR